MRASIQKEASLEAMNLPSFKKLLKFRIDEVTRKLDAGIYHDSKEVLESLLLELRIYEQLLDDYKFYKSLKKDSKCVL